jgi:hypothetical protein
MLVKQGAVEYKQVNDIVHRFSSPSAASPFCESASLPHETSTKSDPAEAGGSARSLQHLELHEHRLLCAGIQSRLASLRERINASGKAVLRPSSAIMDQSFAPALDYLRGVVRDFATSSSQVVAEADVSKRSREDDS